MQGPFALHPARLFREVALGYSASPRSDSVKSLEWISNPPRLPFQRYDCEGEQSTVQFRTASLGRFESRTLRANKQTTELPIAGCASL